MLWIREAWALLDQTMGGIPCPNENTTDPRLESNAKNCLIADYLSVWNTSKPSEVSEF